MWIEAHGKVWRIRDLVGGRKVTIGSGYATKTAAKAARATAAAAKLRGDALAPRGGRMLLTDWIAAWWPTYEVGLKPSARRSEESRMRIHIRPALGAYALDDLDPLVIQRFVAGLSTGTAGRRKLAPKTVANVHGVLHKILDAAVGQRLIRANPATRTGLPKKRHREMRFLTAPEAGRLLAATPEHWRPLVLVLLATGLRYGEAIGLKVGRVDVLAGTLTVLETMHEAGKGQYVFTEPKSERSRRTVTFPPEVAAGLVPLVANKGRHELVFTEPDGAPVTRNFRTRVWARNTAAAGLPGVRIHDLRHTHAGALISANTPLTAVQRRLGHSSIRVTSDMYGHLMPEVHAGILSTISAFLPKIGVGGEMGESNPEQPGATRRETELSAGRRE